MKYLIILYILTFFSLTLYCQDKSETSFKLNVNYGKSFLSYGDIWGSERKIAVEYGKNLFIAYEYGFADFSGSEFTEDYYNNLLNSSLVTKHMNSFIGGNQEIKFFGYKSLDTKSNLININSHQIKIGYTMKVIGEKLKFGVNVTGGIYKLDRIGTDFILRGVNITNPSFLKENVTIFGTYTHSYLDFSYGFGTEIAYEILKNRLTINLGANASLSSVRWFTVALGSKVQI